MINRTSDTTELGVIVTYTFKILEDAAAGEKQVNLLNCEVASFDNEVMIPFTLTPAKVTVEGESSQLDFGISHSASFGNNLSLNYYIPAEKVEGYELDRLEIRQVHYTGAGTDYEMREFILTEWKDAKVSGQNYKRMVFSNIAAKEIGDELYATLYLTKDGKSYQNAVDVYNPGGYAELLCPGADVTLSTIPGTW